MSDPKEQQRRHWKQVAEGWARWLEWTERNFAPITAWLHQTSVWRPGTRVLDVACGVGYPALAAAHAVGSGGRVVAIDFAAEMIAAAAARAQANGIDNIKFLEMDAEDLEFEGGSFDGVTNACGLMFCPDPQRALHEAHRVLAPGGRVALVVWDEPASNPFFEVFRGVAAALLALPQPDSAAPGPFRFAAAGTLESLVEESGFSDVRTATVAAAFACASLHEYRQLFTDVAMKRRMASLSPEESSRFHAALADAARPYERDGGLRMRATARCVSARK